jgi:hypothetical protein
MLNAYDEALLVALRRGNHFKANPGIVEELLAQKFGELGDAECRSSARRLHANGLATFVKDSYEPGRTQLRITDDGIAYADLLIEATRTKTVREHLKDVSRSDWISLLALIVSAVALFKGD